MILHNTCKLFPLYAFKVQQILTISYISIKKCTIVSCIAKTAFCSGLNWVDLNWCNGKGALIKTAFLGAGGSVLY